MKKCKTSKLKNKYQTHPKERERKTGKEIGGRTEDRKDFFFFFFWHTVKSFDFLNRERIHVYSIFVQCVPKN